MQALRWQQRRCQQLRVFSASNSIDCSTLSPEGCSRAGWWYPQLRGSSRLQRRAVLAAHAKALPCRPSDMGLSTGRSHRPHFKLNSSDDRDVAGGVPLQSKHSLNTALVETSDNDDDNHGAGSVLVLGARRKGQHSTAQGAIKSDSLRAMVAREVARNADQTRPATIT